MALSVLNYGAMGGSRIVFSLMALDITDSIQAAGVVMGVFTLAPVLGSIHAGRLIDRVGTVPPMAAGLVLSALALLPPFFFPNIGVLLVSSVLTGISFVAVNIALTNAAPWLGNIEQRTANMGWVFLGNSIGLTIGPVAAGFSIDHTGYGVTFLLCAAVLIFAALLLVPWRRHIPTPPPASKLREPIGLVAALREPTMSSLVTINMLIISAMEAFYFIVPLHGARTGLSASTIGLIISCAFAANCVTRALGSAFLTAKSEVRMLVAIQVVAAVSIFPFAHFTNPAVLMLLSAGVGICHGISMPILASLVYTASPPGRQAELGGARQVVTFTGMSLTQFLAGSLGGMVGLAPVAWLLALMAGGAAWYTKRRLQENPHAL